MHGHLLPTRYEGRPEKVGGLLRAATLIKSLRAEKPNVLLLDAGDLIQGGAESLLTDGRVMTRYLDEMGYAAWTIGNHDLDWGWEILRARHLEPKAAILGANMITRNGRPNPLARVEPFILREFEGVRVAIIGLTTPGIPSWSLPYLLGDLQFESSADALRRVMPLVHDARPDVIVVVAHQGRRPAGDDHANEVHAIARQFPEITAIIGAHSHVVEENRMVDRVLFTQAGYHGGWVGCLDLAFDTVTRQVVSRDGRILEVGDHYPPDPQLESALSNDLAKARAYLADVIGFLPADLTSKLDVDGRSPVQQLISEAIAARANADVVIHGVFNEEPFRAGPITRADLMELITYENAIGVALLTPAEIQRIVDEIGPRFGTINYMGLWGMTYEKVDGGRRALRLPDGSTPHPRKRFRVAFNSYVLASGGKRFPVLLELTSSPEARLELIREDTRDVVTKYLRRKYPQPRDGGTP